MGPPLPEVVRAREGLVFGQHALEGLVIDSGIWTVSEGDMEEEDLDEDHEDGLEEEGEVEACAEPVEYSVTVRDRSPFLLWTHILE